MEYLYLCPICGSDADRMPHDDLWNKPPHFREGWYCYSCEKNIEPTQKPAKSEGGLMADETERIEEMASTMKAAALDEMKAELEAAGYDVVEDLGLGFVYAPNRSTRFYGGDNVNEAIEYAYRHFQEKRRIAELEAHNAAMKALLEEMLDGANFEYVMNWKEEIKRILGKAE